MACTSELPLTLGLSATQSLTTSREVRVFNVSDSCQSGPGARRKYTGGG